MEKKNYILLFLQIAAIAVSGVLGGDTTFALITALIGITFNFLVSMNIASGFLFGFVYAVCNGILAWQEKRDRSDYEENGPQRTELNGRWRDCVIRDYDRHFVRNKRCVQRKCIV